MASYITLDYLKNETVFGQYNDSFGYTWTVNGETTKLYDVVG